MRVHSVVSNSDMDAIRTSMHCSQHARDKFVDTVTFLHQGDKRRDSALVVGTTSKMGKDELLESINLVLQSHEVCDRLVSAKWISRWGKDLIGKVWYATLHWGH